TANEAGPDEVGAGEGDTITIEFNVDTNEPDISPDVIETAFSISRGGDSIADGLGTVANGLSAVWLDARTLEITLGSDATVKLTDTIAIHAAVNIRDYSGESATSTSSIEIDNGTFGSATPSVVSVQALEEGEFEVGAGEGDTVTIIFDEPTSMPDITPENIGSAFVLSAGSWGTVAGGVMASWSDEYTLVITLGSDATVKKGATFTIDRK